MLEQTTERFERLEPEGAFIPPFESSQHVSEAVANARKQWIIDLKASGFLEIPKEQLLNPAPEVVKKIEILRKSAVRYRSVMWFCGVAQAPRFAPYLAELPGNEGDLIFALGQYRDAVEGRKGNVGMVTEIALDLDENLQVGSASVGIVNDRITRASHELADLVAQESLSDDELHRVRIMLRGMRDLYKASLSVRPGENSEKAQVITSWFDAMQKICNTMRGNLPRGDLEHREGPDVIQDRGQDRYQLPVELVRAVQLYVRLVEKYNSHQY